MLTLEIDAQVDEATRQWYQRALKMMQDTGCSLATAIAAIEESGKADY